MKLKSLLLVVLTQLMCVGSYANVFGTDEREILPASVFLPVGKLRLSPTSFCTATLIGLSKIVTAAHCLLTPRTLQLMLNTVPLNCIGIWP